jgi:hypothetical protein
MEVGRDLRGVLVNAARAATRSDDFWKAELARLEPRLGRNKAMVAIARKLLVVVWHVLSRQEADKGPASGPIPGSTKCNCHRADR